VLVEQTNQKSADYNGGSAENAKARTIALDGTSSCSRRTPRPRRSKRRSSWWDFSSGVRRVRGHAGCTLDHVEQYGLNSAKLARGWITDDEVLIVAMTNRTIILHDIRAGKRIGMLRDVESAEFAADIRLSSDRSQLVMMTEGGRIGIFSAKSGVRMLGGYFIDDELILHNDDGYYLSTPEGAHFVHVRFPGSPGYSTVQQFARTLNRAEAIRDILRGKPSPPRPDLTPPPRLHITATIAQPDVARLVTVNLKATSETGLARLSVFVDGRLVRELEATGPSFDENLEVSVPPEARWNSASQSMPGASRATRKLRLSEAPASPLDASI